MNFVIFVPHSGHIAFKIGLPLVVVSLLTALSSTVTFFLHFTQYISAKYDTPLSEHWSYQCNKTNGVQFFLTYIRFYEIFLKRCATFFYHFCESYVSLMLLIFLIDEIFREFSEHCVASDKFDYSERCLISINSIM